MLAATAILAAALLPAITAELPKEFRRSAEPAATRVAYMRAPGGRYYLGMVRPLFDVTTAGVVVTAAGGGGGVGVSGTNVWTGSNTFTDSLFFIVDDGDATKKLQFQLSSITTGNTVVPFTFGGTAAAPWVVIPNGLVGTPGLTFANDADTGIYSRTATAVDIGVNGVGATEWQVGGVLILPSGGSFNWSSAAVGAGSLDTVLNRELAATIQHGVDLNGAAIAQTDKACDGITGTDIAGCDYILAGGRGTGTGAPGDVHLQSGKDLATGTTAQTLFERHFYRGKAKALTESSATTFVTFNIPTTLTAVGGTVRYCVHATDATDVQERCGEEDFACVNKAGTVTPSTPNLIGTEATAITSGTLTNTMTMVNSGTTCSMQANAASSLTQTILDIRYSVELQGSGTVTP